MKLQALIPWIAIVSAILITGCDTDVNGASDSSSDSSSGDSKKSYGAVDIAGLFMTDSSRYLYAQASGKFILIDLSGDEIRGTGGDDLRFNNVFVDADDTSFTGWFMDNDMKVVFRGNAEFESQQQYSLHFGAELDYGRFDKVSHTDLLTVSAERITDEVDCNGVNRSPHFTYDTATAANAGGFVLNCHNPRVQAIGFALGEYTYIFRFGTSESGNAILVIQ